MTAVSFDSHITPLYSAVDIQRRVSELGAQLTQDYAGRAPVVVAVMKGAMMFTSDLVRAIRLPVELEVLGVSSYEGTQTTGHVRLTTDLNHSIMGRDVVLCEDIIDTGLTMDFLLKNLQARQPASLKVCSLLVKPSRARVAVPIDYRGFTIDDKFVVGYGLDFNGKYRNLPYIGVMSEVPR